MRRSDGEPYLEAVVLDELVQQQFLVDEVVLTPALAQLEVVLVFVEVRSHPVWQLDGEVVPAR